ncbi:MAG: hypothetical protein UY07_C0028G0005 [Parcubacteria group bacterium GW2011_GWA1_47_8]|nr:MAG: hypothetical protein UY07_C0028G0005 [Parcubacteria group bacterium GW2011_GWA1_47_8]
MPDVEFYDQDSDARVAPTAHKSSTFVKLLMQYKIAKDEKTANYILLGVSVVFLVISAIIFFW